MSRFLEETKRIINTYCQVEKSEIESEAWLIEAMHPDLTSEQFTRKLNSSVVQIFKPVTGRGHFDVSIEDCMDEVNLRGSTDSVLNELCELETRAEFEDKVNNLDSQTIQLIVEFQNLESSKDLAGKMHVTPRRVNQIIQEKIDTVRLRRASGVTQFGLFDSRDQLKMS